MSASVFPARAGMSRHPAPPYAPTSCVPRASGDEPSNLEGVRNFIQCSPRERG